MSHWHCKTETKLIKETLQNVVYFIIKLTYCISIAYYKRMSGGIAVIDIFKK